MKIFYDTLINPTNIIQPVTWDDGSAEPISAPVGLLKESDYSSAGSSSSYLNIGYYWWLITPSGSNVRNVNNIGYLNSNSPASSSNGVRPSIYLKSNIVISGGSGLKGDPYRVEIGN